MSTSPKYDRIGFDGSRMVHQLLELLTSEGGVSANDPRVVAWNAKRKRVEEEPEGVDDEAKAELRKARQAEVNSRLHGLWSLGMEHVLQHGAEKDGGPRCKKTPCRTAGISGALVELMTYPMEKRGRAEALFLAEEIKKFKSSPAPVFGLLSRFLNSNRERAAYSRSSAKLNDQSVVCLSAIEDMFGELNRMQVGLLKQLESPQFQQPASGRSAELLLTAIYQHLRIAGGFPLKELGYLHLENANPRASELPDAEKEGALKLGMDAIKKRLRGKDVRTWHPYVRAKKTVRKQGEETDPGQLLP